MNKKSLFKILCVFVLVVSLVSSFAITSSAASSPLRTGVVYRFVDSPFVTNSMVFTDLEFRIDGVEYNYLEISVTDEGSGSYVDYILVARSNSDDSFVSLNIYEYGFWVSDDLRFIEFLSLPDSVFFAPEYSILRNILVDSSDPPYSGLYGNVYSLIQDKIYGGYPLTGGAEIACSMVSTFLTIFVLVLPLALVWLIIKSLTSLVGRVY